MTGARACVFDAYGTLFDVASAAEGCRDALGEGWSQLSALWREKQLQYTWLRAAQGRHADFWRVTGDALDFAMESLGIADAPLHGRLMGLYLKLSAFPDVEATLAAAKAGGLMTAILSNGSPFMLDAAVAHSGIGRFIDRILSVEAVKAFKPHPSVYALALEQLRLAAGDIAFVSANAWDAHAAAAFGLKAIWCNRYRQKPERLPGTLAHVISSLAELPALLLGAREEKTEGGTR